MVRKVLAAAILEGLLFCVSCNTKSSPDDVNTALYNLDFEYSTNSCPDRWQVASPALTRYDGLTDKAHKQHGKSSLKLVQTDTTGKWGAFFQQLPTGSIADKEIELTGWIRTEAVDSGFAGLYLYSKDENPPASMLADPGEHGRVKGTADWKKVSVRIRVGRQVEYITFGGVLTGSGAAWFDNLELSVDGEKIAETLLPAPKMELTKQDKRELSKYIYPLRTCSPDGGDTHDLSILRTLIGGSHIVALGENTHGSSEIFQLKNRIIQYLAANEDFDIFSIEANMPESYKLNQYTLKGAGDPQKLIAGMYFWTWNTHEMLDLVEWMRTFNQAKPKIYFTGFDMQFYEGSIAELCEGFKNDMQTQRLIQKIQAAFKLSGSSFIEPKITKTVTPLLEQLTKQVELLPVSEEQKAWLRQHITLLRQYSQNSNNGARDGFMADNLMWIKTQNPTSKIVAWAHNMHIMQTGIAMGHRLKEKLGDDYRTFGFTFYDGSYTAFGNRGLSAYPAQCAKPGSLEYLLRQLDEPLFILNLKKLKAEHSPALKWINNLDFRFIGACTEPHEFSPFQITDTFDYLIFIRKSSPSQRL